MTEKQEEICECGHTIANHANKKRYCFIKGCPCKKFTPKNHSPSKDFFEQRVETPEGTQNHKKGCGKPILHDGDTWAICGDRCVTCGYHLCPICQEKEK